MRSTSNRLAALPSFLALCMLAPSGCDKGESADEKKDAPKTAKADEPKADEKKDDPKADEKKDDPKADEKTDKPSEKDAEIAALKAELEAAKEEIESAKEIDPELAKKLDEPPKPEDEIATEKALEEGEKGPVSLANLAFTDKEMWGDRGVRFEISADITVNEAKDGGVYAKASCVLGDEVYVNVGTISNNYGDLGKMKAGDTKRLDTTLFGSGLPEKPTRCQLSFDYGAQDFSTRISDSCWDGKTITDGECKEPIKAVKKGDGKIVPFGFEFKQEEASRHRKVEGDPTSINLSFGARFNEHIERAPHLHTKTSCKVGDRIWVEVSPDYPHVKPFSLEDGEAVMVHHSQFYMNPLSAKPEACNIHVSLDGGWDKADEPLGDFCAKTGAVTEGQCAFKTAPADPPAPMAADSIEIDEIAFEWDKDWRDDSKAVLNMRLAATVAKGISNRVQLKGTAKCGDTEDDEHHIGPDLEYVSAGETVAISMTAFRRNALDAPSGRCEVTFSAEPFMGRGDAVEVAKFCLKGDKVNKGKCKGKGKGKAIKLSQEIVFKLPKK